MTLLMIGKEAIYVAAHRRVVGSVEHIPVLKEPIVGEII
jgi:hypothetical protein